MSNSIDLELIRRYKDGDNAAIEKLIVKYEFLIKKVCNSVIIYDNSCDVEDLRQYIMIELCTAAKNFDEEKGVKFITYLHNTLFNTSKSFVNKISFINYPINIIEKASTVRKKARKEYKEDCEITFEFVREIYKTDTDSVINNILSFINTKVNNIDVKDNEGKEFLHDFLGENDSYELLDNELIEMTREILDEKTFDIIMRRIINEEYLKDIANDYKMSIEWCRQIEKKGKEKIKTMIIRKGLKAVYGF